MGRTVLLEPNENAVLISKGRRTHDFWLAGVIRKKEARHKSTVLYLLYCTNLSLDMR